MYHVLFYVYCVVLYITCCSMYHCVVLCILCCSMYISLFYVLCVVLCILRCSMYHSVVLCITVLFYVSLCCSMYISLFYVLCVVLCINVLFYVLFVCKCVLYYCHRVTTQLQLTNISISYRILSTPGITWPCRDTGHTPLQ
jgi:hypothetical protein